MTDINREISDSIAESVEDLRLFCNRYRTLGSDELNYLGEVEINLKRIYEKVRDMERAMTWAKDDIKAALKWIDGE